MGLCSLTSHYSALEDSIREHRRAGSSAVTPVPVPCQHQERVSLLCPSLLLHIPRRIVLLPQSPYPASTRNVCPCSARHSRSMSLGLAGRAVPAQHRQLLQHSTDKRLCKGHGEQAAREISSSALALPCVWLFTQHL